MSINLYPRPKAVRKHCLDCANTAHEVRNCHIVKCPLWAYRFGKKPTKEMIKTLREWDETKNYIGE